MSYVQLRLILTSISLLFSMSLIAVDNQPVIHEVKAQKGDGVLLILKRYQLHRAASNRIAFYNLNGLKEGDGLKRGRSYKLPVYLYTYNDLSIRSTINRQDWDSAVRIKEYNEELLARGRRSTHYTVSKILWVPFHLLAASDLAALTSSPVVPGPTKAKKVPTAAKINSTFNYRLFGESHNAPKPLNKSLAGHVFYVVTGHGGPDPGTMCTDLHTDLCEDEYAYDVALRLAENLLLRGATVEMVIQDLNDGLRDAKYLDCDMDERLADGSRIPLNHKKRLQQRTNYINKKHKVYRGQNAKSQTVISIHVDSNSKSHRQDVFFCYTKGSKESKKLAGRLKDTFASKYAQHQKNRGYRGYLQPRSLYVLRHTIPTAVLIELGNIKNHSDHRRILLKENRQAVAKWLYEGLTKHVRSTSEQIVASS